MAPRTLIGLGQAYEMQYVPGTDLAGRPRTVRFAKVWWWAWDGSPEHGNILLVKVLGAADARTPRGRAMSLHRTFHGAAPTGMLQVDAWEQAPPLNYLGRVVSIAYDARAISATKGDLPYRHHFGAMTHADRPPFDPAYWPDMVLDADHNLAIRRRPGNTFTLDDWLTG